MNKNILLITGGTGGHVIPAQNLANYLIDKNINCRIIVDKRGYKYINNFKGKVYVVNSSNLNGNFILKITGFINLILGFFQSFIIILFFKPTRVISFGSYASFFPMLCCAILKPFYKIKLFIHEQNSVIGRTNSFFLTFTNKLFLNFDISLKIKSKYKNKIFVVGSPQRNTGNYLKKHKHYNDKFTIFIFGGSQGSEFISKFSLKLIKCIDKEKIINSKFIIQCPKHMIKNITNDIGKLRSEIIINDFFSNIDEVLQSSSLVISRSGAGSIGDIINNKIPSILIPLPTSKDNHQYYNALILEKHEVAIILDQNIEEINKAKKYIYEIYNNTNKVKKIYHEFDKIKVKNPNSLIYSLISDER